MAVPLKLTNAQHQAIMNNPLHYDLSMRYSEKDGFWECDCDAATAKRVKAIVDTPAPPKTQQ